MTTAVVDSIENERRLAGQFPDALVVEQRCAPQMDAAVLERTVPVGSAPALHKDVRPEPGPRQRGCRWVRDPLCQQTLICVWEA